MRVQIKTPDEPRFDGRKGTIVKLADEGTTAFVQLDDDGGWLATREVAFQFNETELTLLPAPRDGLADDLLAVANSLRVNKEAR